MYFEPTLINCKPSVHPLITPVIGKEIPAFLSFVEYDGEGNALLNAEQAAYANREVLRCKKGFW